MPSRRSANQEILIFLGVVIMLISVAFPVTYALGANLPMWTAPVSGMLLPIGVFITVFGCGVLR